MRAREGSRPAAGNNCIEVLVQNNLSSVGAWTPTGFNLTGQFTADHAARCCCEPVAGELGCLPMDCPNPDDTCGPTCVTIIDGPQSHKAAAVRGVNLATTTFRHVKM